MLGLFLGLLLLAYPGYLAYRGSKLPAITDITTDTANPPRFDLLARLRPRGSNDYPGAKTAALQRAAYPDIAPLEETRRRPPSPFAPRWRWSTNANGSSSMRARPRRRAATASSRRWRARSSWASATTWWCA